MMADQDGERVNGNERQRSSLPRPRVTVLPVVRTPGLRRIEDTHPSRFSGVRNTVTPMWSGRGASSAPIASRPTVRKAESHSGNGKTQEAKASRRKARGNNNPLDRAAVRRRYPGRKAADVRLVSPREDAATIANRRIRSMQTAMPVTETERPTDWNRVNWRDANRRVRNLRQRIFRATQRQDWQTVRSLQRLMLRSHANTLVSVRRVTQLNHGKHTAGVDKVVVKTPAARGKLVDQLMTSQPWRARPARRVYIPKANGTLRPLGIPTVLDRCLQARVKNALEPAWEARFEGSSYGFRPGRSAQDAIARAYLHSRSNTLTKWVVDADIKGAFDNIDHAYLLTTIGDVPGRGLIKQWLKAGYMEDGVWHDTDAGTPQGGVITPPTICQITAIGGRSSRCALYPEHDLHRVMIHLDPLD